MDLSSPYTLSERSSAGLYIHVFVFNRHLHFVLPALTSFILDAVLDSVLHERSGLPLVLPLVFLL